MLRKWLTLARMRRRHSERSAGFEKAVGEMNARARMASLPRATLVSSVLPKNPFARETKELNMPDGALSPARAASPGCIVPAMAAAIFFLFNRRGWRGRRGDGAPAGPSLKLFVKIKKKVKKIITNNYNSWQPCFSTCLT